MDNTTLEQTVPGSEPNLLERLWGTLVAPIPLFAHLKTRPRVLGALLVVSLLGAAAGFMLKDLAAAAQIEQLETREGVTDEQLDQAIEQSEKFKNITPVFAVLGIVLTVFITAGALLFLGNVLLGGEARYKELVSAQAHIGIVNLPAWIVKIPLMLSQESITGVQIGPAALFAADGSPTFLTFVLQQFDLFTLWQVGLSVLALAVVAGIPVNRAGVAVVGAWLLWVLGSSGLQAGLANLSG